MKMRCRWLAVTIALFACGPSKPASTESAQLDALARETTAFSGVVADAQAAARHLTIAWRDVADAYDRASARYEIARKAFDAATASADRASATFAAAQSEFEYATKVWQFYEKLVVVAAAIDEANLTASRAGGVAREVECQPMSTQQYRRVLEKRGVDLTGKDIDHIVPHALGGADDVSNYELLDSSKNRSIGALWGHEKCEIAGMPACVVAVAISRRCGSFSGPMPW
jgi:hypothetical protein